MYLSLQTTNFNHFHFNYYMLIFLLLIYNLNIKRNLIMSHLFRRKMKKRPWSTYWSRNLMMWPTSLCLLLLQLLLVNQKYTSSDTRPDPKLLLVLELVQVQELVLVLGLALVVDNLLEVG